MKKYIIKSKAALMVVLLNFTRRIRSIPAIIKVSPLLLLLFTRESCKTTVDKNDTTRPKIEWEIEDLTTGYSTHSTNWNNFDITLEQNANIKIGDKLKVTCTASDSESGIKKLVVHCNFSPICNKNKPDDADPIPTFTQDIIPFQQIDNSSYNSNDKVPTEAIVGFTFETISGHCVGGLKYEGVKYWFKAEATNFSTAGLDDVEGMLNIEVKK